VSTPGLAELADRTLLEPDGWSVLVVEEAWLDAAAQEMAKELTLSLQEEGTGKARIFTESQAGPRLVEEIAGLEPGDVALLPLPANIIESVSHALDYGRGRLLGHPRGMILTSEAGVRVLAAEASNFWSWIGPRVWHRTEPPINDNANVGTKRPEAVRDASQGSSRLVRVKGVLTIDPGIREAIPAEAFDHRAADGEDEDGVLRGAR
jgi:hypothetical protein